MRSAALLLALALHGVPLGASVAAAQDVSWTTSPDAPALFGSDDARPAEADQLWLAAQGDVEPEAGFIPLNLGASVTLRPTWAQARGGRLMLQGLLGFRARAPVAGTQPEVAYRTATNSGEMVTHLALRLDWWDEDWGLHATAAARGGLQQADVPREIEPGEEKVGEVRLDALFATGLASTGVSFRGLELDVELAWHRVLVRSQNAAVFEEVLEDEPWLAFALSARLTRHLFTCLRVLPTTTSPLPARRWTFGIVGVLDPLHD